MGRRYIAIAIIILVIALGAWRWASRRSDDSETTLTFSTYTQSIMAAPVTIIAPEARAAEASEIVFGIFRDIDTQMSEWKPDSPLTAVNEAAGRHPVEVPADLLRVVLRGIELGEMTDGAFDITWAALWGLWDFKTEPPVVPPDEEIERRVGLVDFRAIVIDEEKRTIFLPREGMMIGLGGIAKGTALNRAAEALGVRGIDNFLISAGGQVIVRGTRGDRPWRIGIRDPRGDIDDYFADLELADLSASTSGDYERFFILGGVRYHHILDPRTGRPVRGLRSATIICRDAELADALSTAAMILGPEDGFALVEALDDVEAVFIDDEGKVRTTRDVADQLHVDPGLTAP